MHPRRIKIHPTPSRTACSGASSALEAWTGALAFTGQIYADFSGYTDMARGIAQLMGFRLMLNFNNPYAATGLGDVLVALASRVPPDVPRRRRCVD